MVATPGSGPVTPLPGAIPQTEVDAVRAAWLNNDKDIGVGLYNPSTGEMHVGTFNTAGQRMGHDGLQLTLAIDDADRPQWRGFIFLSSGQAMNLSGFNILDGTGHAMRLDYFAQVWR